MGHRARHDGARWAHTRSIGAIAVTAVVGVVAPPALAGGGHGHTASSTYGYSGPAGTQVALQPPAHAHSASAHPRSPASAATPAASASSTLPYTGLDLAVICGAGLVLIGVGVGIHAFTRRPHTTP